MDVTVRVIEMPLEFAFGHAKSTRRKAANVVVVVDREAGRGIGECVPREYVTGETVESVLKSLQALDVERLASALTAETFEAAVTNLEHLRLAEALRNQDRPALAAACAIELACLDAVGREFGRSLADVPRALGLSEELWRDPPEEFAVPTFLDFNRQVDELAADVERGARHVKVKVGDDRDLDMARLRELRRRFGDAVTAAVDANMAWTLGEALARMPELRELDIKWLEEPLAQRNYPDLRALRAAKSLPVMLDESLCSWTDAVAAQAEQACDMFNVRISKCGGFLPSLRLIEFAHRHGLRYQIGAHVGEMGILWAAGLRLASCVRGMINFEVPIPDRFFCEQIIQEPITTDWSRYRARTIGGHGWGVTLDEQVLNRFTASTLTWTSRRGRWTSP